MSGADLTLPERGAKLRDAEIYWLAMGGEVESVRRHGETDYTHPSLPGFRVRVNARRKDAPIKLIHRLKRATEELTALMAPPAFTIVPRPVEPARGAGAGRDAASAFPRQDSSLSLHARSPRPPALGTGSAGIGLPIEGATPPVSPPEPQEAPVTQHHDHTQNGHEPYVRIETISPERAAKLLAAMPTNRSLRQRTVQKYAREMMSGRWLLNGEGIKMGKSGHVIDGQHRLNAIVMAKVAVKTLVLYNVDDAARLTIDTGIGRTYHDSGLIAGAEFSRELPAALRYYWLYECQSTPFSKTAASHQEMEAIRLTHPQAEQSVQFVRKLKAIRSYMVPSVQAFVHSYCSEKFDRELADTFMQDLNDGASLEKTSPIFLLRRLLVEGNVKGRRLDPIRVLALTIKAWNAWFDGDKIAVLRYTTEEEFPRFGKTNKDTARQRRTRAAKREGGIAIA